MNLTKCSIPGVNTSYEIADIFPNLNMSGKINVYTSKGGEDIPVNYVYEKGNFTDLHDNLTILTEISGHLFSKVRTISFMIISPYSLKSVAISFQRYEQSLS